MAKILSHAQLDRRCAQPGAGGVAWLLLCLVPLRRREWRLAATRFARGVTALCVAYGVMLLDRATDVWARLSLDYSTHTAAARRRPRRNRRRHGTRNKNPMGIMGLIASCVGGYGWNRKTP